MNERKLQETVDDKGAWHAAIHDITTEQQFHSQLFGIFMLHSYNFLISESIFCIMSIFLNLIWHVSYDQECCLYWWNFYMSLRITYILALLCNKYFINVNHIQLIDGAVQFNFISLMIFCLLDLSVTKRRVLKSPKISII